MVKRTGLLLLVLAAVALSGCQSADLIDLNNRYISLFKQQAEIDGLVKDGLGLTDAAIIRTGIQSQFADIGDDAIKSAEGVVAAARGAGSDAEKVKALRNEASYLSVAVRSYLSSGRIADHKMVAPAARGIAACRGLTGLQGLPTTCGYFHIARHVGAYNETIRNIRPVFNRALALRPGQSLSTDEGRALEAATNGILAQLRALSDTGADSARINFAEAGEGLRTHFNTQQNKFLCNAIRLQARIINARSDPAWNAADSQKNTKKNYESWIRALKQRPAGFERRRDCKVQSPVKLSSLAWTKH